MIAFSVGANLPVGAVKGSFSHLSNRALQKGNPQEVGRLNLLRNQDLTILGVLHAVPIILENALQQPGGAAGVGKEGIR